MKYLLNWLVCCFASLHLNGQYLSVTAGAGLLESDIVSKSTFVNEFNTPKKRAWVNVGAHYRIRKWLSLEFNLGYQERKALEIFIVPIYDPSETNEGFHQYVFLGKYPTSPQSAGFNDQIYIHLPNFKYLNYELIPTFSFGKSLSLEGGLGIFYSNLLNYENLVFTKDDFPHFSFLFNDISPREYRSVRYYKKDSGYVAKLGFRFAVPQSRVAIGLNCKYYHSKMRMNDSFVMKKIIYDHNFFWRVLTLGVNVQYRLSDLNK